LPRDAGLVAERLENRLAEHDRDVLDRVVGVDVRVARCPYGQVGQRVLRERGQHVIEEGNGRVDPALTRAIEVQLKLDGRLGGAAGARGGAGSAHDADPIEASASRNAVVSASVPAVTRRWPGMPTSRPRMPRSYS